MNKKILVGSVLVLLLMLLTPMVSSIKLQESSEKEIKPLAGGYTTARKMGRIISYEDNGDSYIVKVNSIIIKRAFIEILIFGDPLFETINFNEPKDILLVKDDLFIFNEYFFITDYIYI